MTARRHGDGLRVVVLADTHVAPRSSRRLPDAAYTHLHEADVVLHAGDLVTADLLDELAGFAPVHAVLGNNDHELLGVLPEALELELAGVRVAMVHDSGPTSGRPRRMRRRFPDADIVVFGHSHLPTDDEGDGGQRLFNPGSATWKRTAPHHTLGRLHLSHGEIRDHRVVALD
ncbi:MAG: Phosphoesterase [Acidimicrobiales bacterium]|nr:Phosphoesterase [Acidimicrobiales bacterium]